MVTSKAEWSSIADGVIKGNVDAAGGALHAAGDVGLGVLDGVVDVGKGAVLGFGTLPDHGNGTDLGARSASTPTTSSPTQTRVWQHRHRHRNAPRRPRAHRRWTSPRRRRAGDPSGAERHAHRLARPRVWQHRHRSALAPKPRRFRTRAWRHPLRPHRRQPRRSGTRPWRHALRPHRPPLGSGPVAAMPVEGRGLPPPDDGPLRLAPQWPYSCARRMAFNREVRS